MRKLSKTAQQVLDRMKGPELVKINQVPFRSKAGEFTTRDFLGVSVTVAPKMCVVRNGSNVTIYLANSPWAEKEEMYRLAPQETISMSVPDDSGTLYVWALAERKSDGPDR